MYDIKRTSEEKEIPGPNQAIIITGLEYQIVERRPVHEMMHSMPMPTVRPCMDDLEMALAPVSDTVQRDVIPIQVFMQMKVNHDIEYREATYIGWSKEVEDFIQVPFRVLHNTIDESQKAYINAMNILGDYRSASLWQRIKYVFTRKV